VDGDASLSARGEKPLVRSFATDLDVTFLSSCSSGFMPACSSISKKNRSGEKPLLQNGNKRHANHRLAAAKRRAT
jgi:hypothetical protein